MLNELASASGLQMDGIRRDIRLYGDAQKLSLHVLMASPKGSP
jgi:hypothetical protein